jgi:internalin A
VRDKESPMKASHAALWLGPLLAAAWVVPATAQNPSSIFADKNLEAAARRYVFEKRFSDAPLAADDVKPLSTIVARNKGIKDLRGLEHCVNLAELDLAGNEIEDITPLRSLSQLQLVDLSRNKIKDISPVASLSNLQYLNLEYNRVEDLKPIERLVKLNSLYLSYNRIRDLRPLMGLTRLWSLYLRHNDIEDIQPLEKLTRLANLDLAQNRIRDLSPLKNFRELKFLFLEENQIQDLTPLLEAVRADAQGPRTLSPFLKLYIWGNPVVEQTDKTQLEELRRLGVRVYDQRPPQQKESR